MAACTAGADSGLALLPPMEGALLWAVRAWAVGQTHDAEVRARIRNLFTRLQAPAAAGCLDGFMHALSEGARRTLAIDCVCQTRVSPDEILVLDVFALQQEAFEDEARALLRRLVSDEAAQAGAMQALGLVLALNGAGHYLPRGQETVRRHAFCHRTIWPTGPHAC